MLPENHDDATFKEFPSLERPFDTYDAPALGVASEALRTFRKIVGYDLNFVRPGAKPAATETAVDDDDVSPLERVESFPVGELGVRVGFGDQFRRRDSNRVRVRRDERAKTENNRCEKSFHA